MTRRPALALVLLLLLGLAAPLGAAEPAAAPSATVADLAWLAGVWKGEVGGSVIKEHWSAPAGGAMMGMFRWLAGAEPRLYEFMTFETEADGRPVLKLRHFEPGLRGWEDKDNPLSFRLVAAAPGELTFETLEKAGPVRLVYRKTGDATMLAILEKSKDGKPAVTEFPYRRQ